MRFITATSERMRIRNLFMLMVGQVLYFEQMRRENCFVDMRNTYVFMRG